MDKYLWTTKINIDSDILMRKIIFSFNKEKWIVQGVSMNIEALKEFLHQISVPKSSYNIDNDGSVITPRTIVIEWVSNRLSVYWTERKEVYE